MFRGTDVGVSAAACACCFSGEIDLARSVRPTNTVRFTMPKLADNAPCISSAALLTCSAGKSLLSA